MAARLNVSMPRRRADLIAPPVIGTEVNSSSAAFDGSALHLTGGQLDACFHQRDDRLVQLRHDHACERIACGTHGGASRGALAGLYRLVPPKVRPITNGGLQHAGKAAAGRGIPQSIRRSDQYGRGPARSQDWVEGADRGGRADRHNTANGRLAFGIFAAFAEFERELIAERTLAGLAAARARGRLGGRPRKMDRSTLMMAMAAMADRKAVASEVAMRLGLTTTTLYVYVRRRASP